MSTLLKYHGHNLDEAMIFGIAHALTFVWMPLIKLNGMPLVSYRTAPRSIIKNTCKALGPVSYTHLTLPTNREV